jgi:recombination protein RecR
LKQSPIYGQWKRSGIYNGYYHILGGPLSAAKGTSPESFRLPALMKRCMEMQIQELIIATNATVEGQTTAFFITEYLRDCKFHISRD